MRRKLVLVLVLIILGSMLVVPVSANAPPDAELEGSDWVSPVAYIIVSAVVLGSILITAISEWLVALVFGFIKEYGKLIVLTNIISQLLMWLVTFTVSALPGDTYKTYYGIFIIVIELLIYVGEFFFYRRKMKTVSLRKCLWYTVCANTLSLLIGILVYNPMISL